MYIVKLQKVFKGSSHEPSQVIYTYKTQSWYHHMTMKEEWHLFLSESAGQMKLLSFWPMYLCLCKGGIFF